MFISGLFIPSMMFVLLLQNHMLLCGKLHIPPLYYILSEYAVEAQDDTFLWVSVLVLGISLDHGR